MPRPDYMPAPDPGAALDLLKNFNLNGGKQKGLGEKPEILLQLSQPSDDNSVLGLTSPEPKPAASSYPDYSSLVDAYSGKGRTDPSNGRLGAYQTYQDMQAKAEQQKSDLAQTKMEAEATALVTRQRAMHQPRGKVDRMSYAEYEALKPSEKAAVDFNTMLVRAVRKDKNLTEEYHPTADQKLVYDEDVKKLFGDDGASDVFAPETVALLRQIKFDDTNADLDDFLGLKAAITSDDLSSLDVSQAQHGQVPEVVNERWELANDLTQSTQAMQEALVKGNTLLQSANAMAPLERNDDLKFMGGRENQGQPALGFRTPETLDNGAPADLNTYFQLAFDRLSNLEFDDDRESIMKTIESELYKPGQFEAFKTYADQRTGMAERFDVPLGETPDVQYRSPEQFRALLGLGE